MAAARRRKAEEARRITLLAHGGGGGGLAAAAFEPAGRRGGDGGVEWLRPASGDLTGSVRRRHPVSGNIYMRLGVAKAVFWMYVFCKTARQVNLYKDSFFTARFGPQFVFR